MGYREKKDARSFNICDLLALKGLKPFCFLFLFFSEMAEQMSSFCRREHRESKKLSGAYDAMRREVNFCFLKHSHMSS